MSPDLQRDRRSRPPRCPPAPAAIAAGPRASMSTRMASRRCSSRMLDAGSTFPRKRLVAGRTSARSSACSRRRCSSPVFRDEASHENDGRFAGPPSESLASAQRHASVDVSAETRTPWRVSPPLQRAVRDPSTFPRKRAATNQRTSSGSSVPSSNRYSTRQTSEYCTGVPSHRQECGAISRPSFARRMRGHPRSFRSIRGGLMPAGFLVLHPRERGHRMVHLEPEQPAH